MRYTKIVATLGPASSSDAVVRDLVAAGVDVFRLNFSHGTPEAHRRTLLQVRGIAGELGRHVGVMQDLSGPKIRTGRLAGGRPLSLERGDDLRLDTDPAPGGAGRVSVSYPALLQAVTRGDRLLLDDGRIELRVEAQGAEGLLTRVIEGGPLGEHKGINAPGVALPASALTAKDVQDLKLGLELGVDFVAVSFVQTASDLQQAREIMLAGGSDPVPLVAKIERPQGVQNIEDILGVCDAVMVARGDLGLELPLERVPRIQKEITRAARARGIPVIVATQVLESMRAEPRPTRAEVSDAANAVDEGADAIMLAGETAIGAFPVRAVQTLDLVMRDAEAGLPASETVGPSPGAGEWHGQALCRAAVTLAEAAHAQAIVAVTRGGSTARLLSALRPRVPTVAATDAERLARRLSLYRGVVPVTVPIADDPGRTAALVGQQLVARQLVSPGAVVVVVNVTAEIASDDANFLKLQRL